MIATTSRQASTDEIAAEMDRRGQVIERLEAALDEAQRKAKTYETELESATSRLTSALADAIPLALRHEGIYGKQNVRITDAILAEIKLLDRALPSTDEGSGKS